MSGMFRTRRRQGAIGWYCGSMVFAPSVLKFTWGPRSKDCPACHDIDAGHAKMDIVEEFLELGKNVSYHVSRTMLENNSIHEPTRSAWRLWCRCFNAFTDDFPGGFYRLLDST